MSAQPVFIVSSGRSGSAMIAKILERFDTVEMHHEYLCTHIQPVAVQYYMGLISRDEAAEALRAVHGAAIHYCERPVWADSSNKLAWLVDVLADVFPEARFVHLLRDGRKVAGSYFRKLADECYDDAATARLTQYVDARGELPAPPPEKRYWWPLPRPDHPLAARFRDFDQFERIAFHWAESNHVALEALEALSRERRMTVKLEALRKDPDCIDRLLRFVGVTPKGNELQILQRPFNVNKPEDRPLTPQQRDQFDAIAGSMMERLDYREAHEYAVVY